MPFENVRIRSLRNGLNPINGAREDLVAGDVVTLSLTDPTGVTSFRWRLTGRPEYSVAGGGGPNPWQLSVGSTATFTVDADAGSVRLDGTYIVECLVNEGSPTATRITTELARLAPVTIPGLYPGPPRTLRKLGMFESLEDTLSIPQVLAGWSTMVNRWLDLILGISLAPPTFPGYGTDPDITTIDVGDAASGGTLVTVARANHQHALAAPVDVQDIAGTEALGSSSRVAREDHVHRGVRSVNGLFGDLTIAVFGGFGTNTQDVGAANDPGTGSLAAFSNHVHKGVHKLVTSAGDLFGDITLASPLISVAGNVVSIDNANEKSLPGGFVSADITTDTHNGFLVPQLSANLTVPKPTGNKGGRHIEFAIIQGSPSRTVTWTGGANGYKFGTAVGVTQAQFDSLLAATPNGGVVLIAFEYKTVLSAWCAVALAGYFV